jgi:ParB-like chromosome segregation protein Spo0J
MANPADKVEKWDITRLTPYARNSRTHSDEQISQLAASIKEWGWTTPVLVDEDGSIIAGHGRTLAAQRLKMTEVPVMVAKGWSEAKKRAYVIADNKLALNAGWDNEMLALEFSELQGMDFDLDLTGFTADEIAALMPEEIEPGKTDEDAVPEVPEQPVTVLGDVWILGKHRLMCGDSTSIDAVDKLMDGQKADMVFTDPPYGMNAVSKDGKVGGSTKNAKAKTYRPVLGDEDTSVAKSACEMLISLDISKLIIWGGNYFTDFLPPTPCWLVWDKQRPEGLTFADGEMAWTNFTTPLKFIRHRWDGYHRASERNEDRVHPTQKPAFLAEWCFKEYGQQNDVVLDVFGGSGSTLIACEKTNRQARLMELDPKYVDVIIKRWQDFTGKKATHAETGKTFDEVHHGN